MFTYAQIVYILEIGLFLYITQSGLFKLSSHTIGCETAWINMELVNIFQQFFER